ncbi:6-phosphogluconolactonase, partial [Rhodococcus opacus RKJ300 = JCM 13270]
MTTTRTTSAPSKPIPYIYDDSEQLAGDVASRLLSEQLAGDVASRLLSNLAQAQKERAYASLVLTGGRTGTAVLERLRTAPNRDIVNWHRVNFFWGDERFVARHHPDRNEKQAREALLDHLPVDPSRVHVMAPCDGGFGNDATAVANAYQALLCAYGRLDRTPL